MSAHAAFNIFNYETIRGVIKAAADAQQWIYLQTSASTVKYYSAAELRNLIMTAAKGFDRHLFKIHLDHCDDLSLIEECIRCQWDSVMIDASHLELAENIRLTKEVAAMAHPENILVEGELGQIGGEEDGFEALKAMKVSLGDVQQFIDNTEVDLLAVGIGNKHGYYESADPKLDLELLKRVHQMAPQQKLVLHGGTGIPTADILRAVKMGIHKINISTELKDTYLNAVDFHQRSAKRHNMIQLVTNTIDEVKNMALEKIHLFAGGNA